MLVSPPSPLHSTMSSPTSSSLSTPTSIFWINPFTPTSPSLQLLAPPLSPFSHLQSRRRSLGDVVAVRSLQRKALRMSAGDVHTMTDEQQQPPQDRGGAEILLDSPPSPRKTDVERNTFDQDDRPRPPTRKRSSAVAFDVEMPADEESSSSSLDQHVIAHRRPSLPGIKNLFGIAGSQRGGGEHEHESSPHSKPPATARSSSSSSSHFPDLSSLSQQIRSQSPVPMAAGGESPSASSLSSNGRLSRMSSFATVSDRERESFSTNVTVPSMRSSGGSGGHESWWWPRGSSSSATAADRKPSTAGGARDMDDAAASDSDPLARKSSFARFAFDVQSRVAQEHAEEMRRRSQPVQRGRLDSEDHAASRQQRYVSYPFGDDGHHHGRRSSRETTPTAEQSRGNMRLPLPAPRFSVDSSDISPLDDSRPPPLVVPPYSGGRTSTSTQTSTMSPRGGSRGSITTAASDANDRERQERRMAREAGTATTLPRIRSGSPAGPVMGPYAVNDEQQSSVVRRESVQIPPDAVHSGMVYHWPEATASQASQRTYFEWGMPERRATTSQVQVGMSRPSAPLPHHAAASNGHRHSYPAEHQQQHQQQHHHHATSSMHRRPSASAIQYEPPATGLSGGGGSGGLEEEMWRKRARSDYPSVLRRDLAGRGDDGPTSPRSQGSAVSALQRTHSAPHLPHQQPHQQQQHQQQLTHYTESPLPASQQQQQAAGTSGAAGPRYVCQACGKSFSRPSSLRIHSYSHSGERPFRCTFPGCQRAFSVQSNLKRHAKIHYQGQAGGGGGGGDIRSQHTSAAAAVSPYHEGHPHHHHHSRSSYDFPAEGNSTGGATGTGGTRYYYDPDEAQEEEEEDELDDDERGMSPPPVPPPEEREWREKESRMQA